jgi:hypothetical protein
MRTRALLLCALAASLVGACVPKNYTPVEQIPALKSLAEVMDVQSTTADPEFAKIGQGTYADADFAAFAETSRKIDATSKHLKDFSKGPEWDALAAQLGAKATALGAAATAKDAGAASQALTDMKATCKACHSKFK